MATYLYISDTQSRLQFPGGERQEDILRSIIGGKFMDGYWNPGLTCEYAVKGAIAIRRPFDSVYYDWVELNLPEALFMECLREINWKRMHTRVIKPVYKGGVFSHYVELKYDSGKRLRERRLYPKLSFRRFFGTLFNPLWWMPKRLIWA